MTPEQNAYYDKELRSIRRGGFSHVVWVTTCIPGMGSENLGPVDPPVVGLANDSDDYYTQYFQNRAQVEVFIAELRKAADEAWPVQYTYLRNIPGLRVDKNGNVGVGF